MTGKGHFATGITCSLIAFDITSNFQGYGIIGSLGIIMGANAPDYLEIWTKKYDRNGKYLTSIPKIKHRTITHILLLWVILLFFSLANLPNFSDNIENNSTFLQYLNVQDLLYLDFPHSNTLSISLFSFLFGFSMGGLLHLLTDLPNPMGIPLIFKKRFSLNLWRSGKNESIIVFSFFLLNLFYFQIIEVNGGTINNIKQFFI